MTPRPYRFLVRTRAQFVVDSEASGPEFLVIRDCGPWDQHPTVTNDAEAVVWELHNTGILRSRRLLCYDSEGDLDELLHDGEGRFAGFAPGSRDAPRP